MRKLLGALAALCLLAASPAFAATQRAKAHSSAAAHVAKPAATDPVSSLLTQVINKLKTAVPDLQTADALAVGPNAASPVDPIAHACYPAEIQFLQSLSAPAASTGGIVTIYEQARLLRMQLQNGLPAYLKIGCAPLVQDESTLLVSLVGFVGVTLSAAELKTLAAAGLILK